MGNNSIKKSIVVNNISKKKIFFNRLFLDRDILEKSQISMSNTNIEKSKKCNFCNKASTDLQCSKAGCKNYICPSCLEQTPVGARCPDCAKMKKNPQFSFEILYEQKKSEFVF